MWPTGIASEEDIHGAAQLLMKSITKIRAAFTFREKFRLSIQEAMSHQMRTRITLNNWIQVKIISFSQGRSSPVSVESFLNQKKQNVTKRKVRMEKFFRKRLTLFACISEGGQRTKYFEYLKADKETIMSEKMITGGTTWSLRE